MPGEFLQHPNLVTNEVFEWSGWWCCFIFGIGTLWNWCPDSRPGKHSVGFSVTSDRSKPIISQDSASPLAWTWKQRTWSGVKEERSPAGRQDFYYVIFNPTILPAEMDFSKFSHTTCTVLIIFLCNIWLNGIKLIIGIKLNQRL